MCRPYNTFREKNILEKIYFSLKSSKIASRYASCLIHSNGHKLTHKTVVMLDMLCKSFRLFRKAPDAVKSHVPRSLNSDISYFGVGGKQAIFFIGNSTRVKYNFHRYLTIFVNCCQVWFLFLYWKDRHETGWDPGSMLFCGYSPFFYDYSIEFHHIFL